MRVIRSFKHKSRTLCNNLYILLYPFVCYYIVLLIAMIILQKIFGMNEETYVIRQAIASLVSIPVLFCFYLEELDRRPLSRVALEYGMDSGDTPAENSEEEVDAGTKTNETQKKAAGHASGGATEDAAFLRRRVSSVVLLLAACVGIILLISFALNNLILMSPLPELSERYQEASDAFFSAKLVLVLFASALIAPVAEELLYRGIFFKRMKTMMPSWCAILLSALIFGLMHMNIVQFIYAFLIGVVLALFMEADGIYLSIAGHIAANTLAVFRTEYSFLDWSMDKSVTAYAVSVAALVAGVALLVVLVVRRRK